MARSASAPSTWASVVSETLGRHHRARSAAFFLAMPGSVAGDRKRVETAIRPGPRESASPLPA